MNASAEGIRTLLMIAFEFPPLEVVGVRRSVGLALHLPEHGVTPVVVTTDRASLEAWCHGRVSEAEPVLPTGLRVHRVPCPLPAAAPHHLLQRPWHYLSLGGDAGRRWAPGLTAIWDRLVAESRASAVYVSVPPFRVAPLALDLARQSGLPFIVDFRDHWSQWSDQAYPTWLHYRADLKAERRCLEGAAAVVGVTAQLLADLRRVHPGVSERRFHVVPNGWDGGEGVPRPRPAAPGPGGPFTIGHAGRFYYSPRKRAAVMAPWWRKAPRHWLQYAARREDWLYRSPYFFFRALAHLLAERPDLRTRVRVRFAGDVEDWFVRQVDEFGLAGVVEHVGRLSHEACLAFEASCDALLVTSVKVVGGRDYCIAGKTFEYLSTGRPILGIVTEGEQRDFLEACGTALVADADDAAAGARAIERLVSGAFVASPDGAFLERFHRREIARRMAAIVRDVAA